MRIAITSGYFDPMHRGHLELLELSRAQGDILWVIVNNDVQGALKKGKSFIDQDTRLAVTAALRIVDRAYLLEKGKVQFEGTGEELIKDYQARKFYLGEDFNM